MQVTPLARSVSICITTMYIYDNYYCFLHIRRRHDIHCYETKPLSVTFHVHTNMVSANTDNEHIKTKGTRDSKTIKLVLSKIIPSVK